MAKVQQNEDTKGKFRKKFAASAKKRTKTMKIKAASQSGDKAIPSIGNKKGSFPTADQKPRKFHKGMPYSGKATPKVSKDTSESKIVVKDNKKDIVGTPEVLPVFQKYNKSIVEKNMFWFEKLPEVPKVSVQSNPPLIGKRKEVAEKLWDNERSIHETHFNRDLSSDTKWLKTVMKSGTLSDKVAAFTMLLQESPVHSLKSLDALLSMAKKKGRRESLMAVGKYGSDLQSDENATHECL